MLNHGYEWQLPHPVRCIALGGGPGYASHDTHNVSGKAPTSEGLRQPHFTLAYEGESECHG